MTEEKPNIAEIYSRQNADEDFGINQKKIENVNNKEKNRVKKKTGKRKVSINRAKAKFFDLYYGHPARDMRLICVTGTTGKTTVAHFIHQILREKGERVAVLASEDEIKIGILHKFLSDAWKAGVKYVVVTAPMDSLAKDIFAGLKIHIAIATNYVPTKLNDASAKEYELKTDTLFDMMPEYVVLNRDDLNFAEFANFKGEKETLTYGEDLDSEMLIESSKLYNKGSEAKLSFSGEHFSVASFLPGAITVSYMAAAATVGEIVGATVGEIIEGIASFEPEEIANNTEV